MPTFKGVTVEIHCPKEPPSDPENFSWAQVEHGPTTEYGTHKLRHTPKMTSHISAVTNCPFAVSIAILDSYEPKVKGDERESLAAYVYFDGKAKEETATLLRRGVETWISSRWIEVGDGRLAEREFVFREVGLENFFNFLDISKEKPASKSAKLNRRHSMPASMGHDLEEDESDVTAKPKESAGQIRVDLFRVRCEGPVRRGVWGDMFKDHLNNGGDKDTESVNDVDVSHTAGFSEPKPLDKETVSTQSVSHLDPEGVVFASFVFFYRSERQLRKMGLIKDPTPASPPRSLTTNNTPAKSSDKHSSFSSFGASSSEVIPKGSNLFKTKPNGFSDFRDKSDSPTAKKSNGKLNGINLDDDNDEPLTADDFNRDPKDMEREYKKTAEEIRIEEELVAEVNRIKLKRTHSTSSLKGQSGQPTTPPEDLQSPSATTAIPEVPVNQILQEPETPAKRRRGSNDADVKSPPPSNIPQRGLTFGGPPDQAPASFGGFLNSAIAMDDEEEL